MSDQRSNTSRDQITAGKYNLHCAFCEDTELCIQRIAGVLLDAEDRKLDSDIERRVGDVGLLVAKTHRPDEACPLFSTYAQLSPTNLRERKATSVAGTHKESSEDLRSYLTGRLVKSGPTNVGWNRG